MRLPPDLERKVLELAAVTAVVQLPRPAPRNEAEFQGQVIALARRHSWYVAHFRGVRVQRADGSVHYETPVQADGRGFLDLVLARERIIWAEVKTDRGRLTAGQKVWVERLRAAGQEVYVWRPRDFREIERILGGKP